MRGPAGEEHPRAKLTWPQVREIRAAFGDGVGIRELALRFRVSRELVGDVVAGRSWADDPEGPVGRVRPDPMKRLARRFWCLVEKTDGCWLWTGSHFPFGYGYITVGSRLTKQIWLAHRLAWVLTNGPILDDLCVCHSCDNPGCVNPAHLFLGTRDENNRDRQEKGRGARGEHQGHAKLTWDEVVEVRRLYALGDISQSELARRFGVSQPAIGAVVTYRSWARPRPSTEPPGGG